MACRPGWPASCCQLPHADARERVTTVTPSAELPSLCQVKCLASSSAAVAAAVTAAQLAAGLSSSHSDAISLDPVAVSLII